MAPAPGVVAAEDGALEEVARRSADSSRRARRIVRVAAPTESVQEHSRRRAWE